MGRVGINLTAPNATLYFEPNFLSMSESLRLYKDLIDNLNWQQDNIFVYGREVAIPRLQAWYGDNSQTYTYSGLSMQAMSWTQTLAELRNRIEQHSGFRFNTCLANLYRDGNDSVGWHSDDEPELGVNPVIASLSLGESRDFQLKHKVTKEKLTIPLKTGSLLLMSGETQHFWQHCIPRTKRVKSPRINLTFRFVHDFSN